MENSTQILVSLFCGLLSIGISLFLYLKIRKAEKGDQKMNEIADAIRIGAIAYLKRQTRYVGFFAAVVAAIFLVIGALFDRLWFGIAIAFLVGAASSSLAGYIGMDITTQANVRTAQAAKKGLGEALNVSFHAGVVMGLAVVGLGLTGISILLLFFDWTISNSILVSVENQSAALMQMIAGMAFGASLVAMFARVGGGIFTKGADVGADLVGKIEKGIPEDDPRNPAVIADNVGDNVGDCAGMGADIFESYVVTLIASMILGNIVLGPSGMFFPLLIAVGGILATFIGASVVRIKDNADPMTALSKGILVTAIVCATLFYFLSSFSLPQESSFGVFLSALVGLCVGLAIVYITDYFTSTTKPPVRDIATSSQTGAGTNLITGIAVGLKSTAPYALTISLGILLSFKFGGVYGVAIATMAMLSLAGIVVAVDTFGPVADNAGGIVEMSGLPASVRAVTERLDAVGNTTKATTKGFAIASAGLAALALLLAFAHEVNLTANKLGITGFPLSASGVPIINIMDASVIIGLVVGGALPFIFSSYALMAVGKAAQKIILEVRRQFRSIDGLMEGKAKPDYASCVDISTDAAIRELLVPGLLAVGTPLAVGFMLDSAAVAGFLVGALISGQLLAVFMSNAGAAWDNGKKYIEQGNLGGKGSEAHKAAVVGDTVGDPFKDTAGPSLNPMIKILNTISILFVSFFLQYALHFI
ncbi:MAG: sodium-translocating pyrophosphatase [Candidatus Anstonellales archaeon]